VPREFEDLTVVRDYEYVLSTSAKRQGALVVERLATYIEKHMHAYTRIVAYVTTRAYRDAVEAAFARARQNYTQMHGAEAPFPIPLLLVPAQAHGTGARDLLNRDHLVELLQSLYPDPASAKGHLLERPVQLGVPELHIAPAPEGAGH
jgi:hypothetical protein